MKTAKLTMRFDESDIQLAKNYASRQGLSVTRLVERYFRRLGEAETTPIPKEVRAIAGVLPRTVDAKAEYREHVLRKHR